MKKAVVAALGLGAFGIAGAIALTKTGESQAGAEVAKTSRGGESQADAEVVKTSRGGEPRAESGEVDEPKARTLEEIDEEREKLGIKLVAEPGPTPGDNPYPDDPLVNVAETGSDVRGLLNRGDGKWYCKRIGPKTSSSDFMEEKLGDWGVLRFKAGQGDSDEISLYNERTGKPTWTGEIWVQGKLYRQPATILALKERGRIKKERPYGGSVGSCFETSDPRSHPDNKTHYGFVIRWTRQDTVAKQTEYVTGVWKITDDGRLFMQQAQSSPRRQMAWWFIGLPEKPQPRKRGGRKARQG